MFLHGIFPPISTPFYPDGKIYYKKLEHNVDRYSRAPIAGMVVQGSTGEAILLSDEERRDVLKAAMAAASGRRPYDKKPACSAACSSGLCSNAACEPSPRRSRGLQR